MAEPPSSQPPLPTPHPPSDPAQIQPAIQSQNQPQPETAPVIPKLDPDAGPAATDPSTEQHEDNTMANHTATPNATATANAANSSQTTEEIPAIGNPIQTGADLATPSKKETSLREFLGKMDEYAPIIPDAVTSHYLTLAGLPPPGTGPNQTPPHLARLLALATQKFIADIAADSYQYARIRASNSSSASNPMGSLNAASGLIPGSSSGAGSAAGAGAGSAAGGGGGEGKGGKANMHLGIQRPGFGGGGSGGSGQGRTVLTMEDLGMAVAEYGVSVKRGEFYR